MPADESPVFVNRDFRKTFSHSMCAWPDERTKGRTQHADSRFPEGEFSAPLSRLPLTRFFHQVALTAGLPRALCHWPEVREVGRRETYLTAYRRRHCARVAVPRGRICSAKAEKRPARRAALGTLERAARAAVDRDGQFSGAAASSRAIPGSF